MAAKYCGSGASADRMLGFLLDDGGFGMAESSGGGNKMSNDYNGGLTGNLLDDDFFLTPTSVNDVRSIKEFAKQSEQAQKEDMFFADFLAAANDSVIEVETAQSGDKSDISYIPLKDSPDDDRDAGEGSMSSPPPLIPEPEPEIAKPEEPAKPKRKKMIIQLLKVIYRSQETWMLRAKANNFVVPAVSSSPNSISLMWKLLRPET